MTRRGDGNGAEAVPLGLEHPGGVVERLVSEGGEHGAEIGSHPGTVWLRLACAVATLACEAPRTSQKKMSVYVPTHANVTFLGSWGAT